MDTIFASTSEHAANLASATSSSKNHKTGGKRKGVTEKKITQTVANICRFVLHKCMHQDGKFFNPGSELGYGEKHDKLRNVHQLHLEDYKMPDIFNSKVANYKTLQVSVS